MNIGDKLRMIPSARLSEDGIYTPLPCTVVYIHPEHRFYTVEFKSEVTGAAFRESFLFPGRDGAEWENRRRKATAHRQLAPGRLKPGGIYSTKG